MKILDEQPKEGQFLAVWKHDGVVWSFTYRIIDGVLYRYEDANCNKCHNYEDSFEVDTNRGNYFPNTKFIVLEPTDKGIEE